jgi:hypothetical protein
LFQFEGRVYGSLGIVFMGGECSKGCIYIAALISNNQLQQHPIIFRDHMLCMSDKCIKLFTGIHITVVINP